MTMNRVTTLKTKNKKRRYVRDYLRNQLTEWKESSIEHHKGLCMISGEKATVVHHIHPFYQIVRESIKSLNIYKGDFLDLYSEEELLLIKNKCLELHYQYGFGACLTNELHTEYHQVFGFRGGKEEFELFVKHKKENIELPEIELKNDRASASMYMKSIIISNSDMAFVMIPESYNQKLILFWMLIHSRIYKDKNDEFYMSYSQISELSGIGIQAIASNVKTLEQTNVITVVARNSKINEVDGCFKKAPNRYKLNMENYIIKVTNEVNFYDFEHKDHIFERLIFAFYNKKQLRYLPRKQYERIKVFS